MKKDQNAENQNVNPEAEKNVVVPQTDAENVQNDQAPENSVVSQNAATENKEAETSKADETKEKSAPTLDQLNNARQALENALSDAAGWVDRARSKGVPGWRKLDDAIFTERATLDKYAGEISREKRADAVAALEDAATRLNDVKAVFESGDARRVEVAEATFFNVRFDGFRNVVDLPFSPASTQFDKNRGTSLNTFKELGFSSPASLPDAFATFEAIYKLTLPTSDFITRFAAVCAVYNESGIYNGDDFRIVAVQAEKTVEDTIGNKTTVKVWVPELIPAALVDALNVKKIVFGSPSLYCESVDGSIGRSGKAKTGRGKVFAEKVSETLRGFLCLSYFDKLKKNELRVRK